MDNEHKTTIIFLTLLAGGFLYMISLGAVATDDRSRISNETRNQLSEFLVVEDGIIESPAVIIIVSNYDEFLDKVGELNQGQIYQYLLSFYVFEPRYTRAWKYTPTMKQDGWNLIWPRYVRGN